MTDEPTISTRRFLIPGNAHEYGAVGLALATVFALVQFGAPVVREFDFLDQKIRDYFIGIAFAGFPFIHRGFKQALLRFKPPDAVRHDLAPWFVTGAFAAALLYAWNLFASMLGGFSVGLFIGAIGQGGASEAAISEAALTSIMAVSLPLTAVAAIFAGVVLNRHTRSHVFAALAFAGLLFIAFNTLTTWVLRPDVLTAQYDAAIALGPQGLVWFFVGMGLVAVIVLAFGCIGVLISRFYREGAIGQITEAARRLPAAERELLAVDIARRLEAAAKPPPRMPAAAP